MPRRHKPRSDYFQYPTYFDVPPVGYPADVLDRFRDQFDLDDEGMVLLEAALASSAARYRWFRQNEEIAPRKGEMRAALDGVVKNARRLQQSLDDMDQISRRRFLQEFHEAEQFLVRHGSNDLDNWVNVCAVQGNEWRIRPLRSDGHAVDRLEWIDLEQALRVIERCAMYAGRKVDAEEPEDKGGRPAHAALDYWLADLALIWTDYADETFTVDFHDDDPVSDAAVFCVTAIHAVEPEIPAKSVRISAKRANRLNRSDPP